MDAIHQVDGFDTRCFGSKEKTTAMFHEEIQEQVNKSRKSLSRTAPTVFEEEQEEGDDGDEDSEDISEERQSKN